MVVRSDEPLDREHPPGRPVDLGGVYAAAAGPRQRTIDEWPGPLPRQRLRGTVAAHGDNLRQSLDPTSEGIRGRALEVTEAAMRGDADFSKCSRPHVVRLLESCRRTLSSTTSQPLSHRSPAPTGRSRHLRPPFSVGSGTRQETLENTLPTETDRFLSARGSNALQATMDGRPPTLRKTFGPKVFALSQRPPRAALRSATP